MRRGETSIQKGQWVKLLTTTFMPVCVNCVARVRLQQARDIQHIANFIKFHMTKFSRFS